MTVRFLILLPLVSFTSSFAQLPHYDIRMDPALYDALYTRDIFSDVYLPTETLNYEGISRTDAQIRFKGHSTRYYPKKSYRLKFSSSFQDVRQINLNSMYTDRSFIRESFCWLLYADIRALAPTASHATATINGSYKGLFLQVDKVDKYFLQKRGRALGPMYEADDYYVAADLTIQPDSLLKLYYAKEIGDASDYSDLRNMIIALNDSSSADFSVLLDSLFDTRSVLNWFAVNVFTMEGDSYHKNYYLYRDTTRATGQWTVIPWDYDISLGRNGDPAIPYPAMLLNDGFAYTFEPLSGPFSVLKEHFTHSPSLMERLRGYLDTLLAETWTEERLHRRIDSLAALVDLYVAGDPDKWGTYEDFQEHREALKYFVTARRNCLLSTFIHPPTGEYNMVVIHPTQTGTPYHCTTFDGREIATLHFTSIDGLDSLLVRARTDSAPPDIIPHASRGHIRRWLEITPYPSTAHFTASIQWMWMDFQLTGREVSPEVQDERLLRCNVFSNGSYSELPSSVNAHGNFVTAQGLTADQCGPGTYLAVLMPVAYTQTWYRHPSYFWQRWYDIAPQGAGRVAVVGEHGTALTSADSGRSWSERSIGINLSFFGVAALGTDTLIACGESGSTYASSDFGATWHRISLPVRSDLHAIHSSGDGSVWVSGKGTVLRSTDRGVTWSAVAPDPAVDYRDILPFSSRRAIAVADSGRISATTDGGQNWSSAAPGGPATLRRITSFAGRHVWAAGDGGKIIASSDSGNTWASKPSPAIIDWKALFLLDSIRVYVAGKGGAIFYTPDSGAHWYRQYSADSHDLNALLFADASHGTAIGSGGTILLTGENGTVTPVAATPAGGPETYVLEQNFPNPFNPTTTISYQIPLASDVKLEVFDVLGRMVTTLVETHRLPGKYTATLDGSRLSSGVYFYRLSAGHFTGTGRMLLLR
jgi:spore coat protein H